MVIDVLLTVAIVTITFGAVAEFHVGIVGVSLATDSALVDIAFFLIGRFGSLFEIDGLG